MQKQYPKKLRKLLSQFPSILPTEYETFYSVFKLVCESLVSQDVTHQKINQISKVYNTVKEMVQAEAETINKQSLVSKQQGNSEIKGNFNSSPKRNQKNSQATLHSYLNSLLQPLLTHLPSTSASKLLYRHFLDSNFYSIIQKQREKAEAIVDEIMGNSNMHESGSMTPLVINGIKGHRKRLLGKLVNQKGASCKLHINGSNQLAVIFWINCFKSDYAVHFDVFLVYFQHYLNTVLTIGPAKNNSPFFSILFPYPSNSSTRSRIHDLIDPDYKYYVTSANCNQLFIQLSQFQIIQQLIQLSLKKQYNIFDKKSEKCLSLKYKWVTEGVKGTVSINNFNRTLSQTSIDLKVLPTPNPASSTIELLSSTCFYLTGNSIGLQTKISNNKYPPTIRFGSLNDNQICIKNKYVSRRQFMIIEEILNNQEKMTRPIRQDDSLTYEHCNRLKPKANEIKQKVSVYYLVCLSPTNHTCLVYPHKVQAQAGLIFKVNGSFIQIVRLFDVFKGMASKNSQKNLANQQRNEKNMFKNDSTLKMNLSESINEENGQLRANEGNQSNFELLTMIPVCKTQQNQQQEQEDKTLLQLPTNKSQMIVDRQLECMFISGNRKNIKFVVNSQNPIINFDSMQMFTQSSKLNNSNFKFIVDDGKYFLPQKTQILVKRANQVLDGHFSDKVRLQAGMRIVLEEIQFDVIQ